MARRRQQADWLAWSLQAILGLAVGVFTGFVLVLLRTRNPSGLTGEIVLPFITGAGLLGAGIASLLGDQLWMGECYRVLAPDAPEHSPISRTVSWWLVAAGIASLTVAVLRRLEVL